ncbi:hypothetical protein ACL02O_06480 [Micromonospora sp. MS34]|uniref:hypothetical protein n=1 Tax=Micromonospora sp. MS34 TaxID=3385971 RepID=UPI0039A1129E
MAFGFVLAITAALCSATAAILQSIGARRVAATAHLDPRLLWRLLRSGPYAAGLALDGASSGLTYTALRTVPLFVVQAVGAANLSLVALVAMLVLHVRLAVRDWVAIGGVVTGLLLLLTSAGTGPPAEATAWAGWCLLAAVLALLVGAYLGSSRMRGPALPGLLAGLSFGSAAVGARLLGRADSPSTILSSPASYAVVLAGLSGLLLYATGLQRGSVTVVSASAIVGQTLLPSVVGWLVLGDHVRPDAQPVAVLGFVLAVSGAIALARHAQPHSDPTGAAGDHRRGYRTAGRSR